MSPGQGCVAGHLACNSTSQFGICNALGSVTWQSVAAGTQCFCAEDQCSIVYAASEHSKDQHGKTQGILPIVTTTQPPQNITDQVLVEQSQTNNAHQPTVTSAATSGVPYIKTCLGGGEPPNWPTMSEWMDFGSMWNTNLVHVVRSSCAQFGQDLNSDQENDDLRSVIESAGKQLNIDPRFLLSVVLQESNGCLRAPTTNYGVVNPGVMQSHQGAFSCYGAKVCPEASINGMILDGANGTSSGDGLKQILSQISGPQDATKYYKAARVYNSGAIASSGLLEDGIATHCYVSDVANRLLGWTKGPSACHL